MRSRLRTILKNTPLLWRFADRLDARFPGTVDYWEERYAGGGNSGHGSYGQLAEFKSRIINRFVAENHIASVLEFGCGDGNQLLLAEYRRYVGLDVSRTAIGLCMETFADDPDKSFFVYDPQRFLDNAGVFSAELVLSLDVIYHLVEDAVFESYMGDLFRAATRYVIVYSSDVDGLETNGHVRHRNFSRYVADNVAGWVLEAKIANEFPSDAIGEEDGSFADFFVYRRI